MAIDPRNGEVRALVGGVDFSISQFDRASQAKRQPGSTFKGIVYAAAIASGASPYDSYLDAPFQLEGYQPLNYGRSYAGWTSLENALAYSINVVAVKILLDVGFEPTIRLAEQMGIQSELQPIPSLALGGSEVTLLELTNVYGTIAARGKHVEAHGVRRIVDRRGKVLYKHKVEPRQALDPISAEILTWMLQKVVRYGTGSDAQLPDRPVAGKTGTSDNSRDLWFIGFIPQLATGIWLGNDDNQPTWGISATAAQTWYDFMATVSTSMKVLEFPPLPKLAGRKGSIKAQPYGEGNYRAATSRPELESGSNNNKRDRYASDSNETYGAWQNPSGGGESAASPSSSKPHSESPSGSFSEPNSESTIFTKPASPSKNPPASEAAESRIAPPVERSAESESESTAETSEPSGSDAPWLSPEPESEPVVEEPVAEEPVIEEPEPAIVEEPEPIVEEPVVEEPVVEEPVVEEPAVEEPVVEEPVIEEPVIEEPIDEPSSEPEPVSESVEPIAEPEVETGGSVEESGESQNSASQ